MPAAAVKGIIISISIIAALGVAVLESPHIQSWLEEQRKRIAELLRSIGEELDPASRRAAEEFAYEGRTPATDASLAREADGSRDAAAIATGSSIASALGSSSTSTIRRAPGQSRMNAEDAEERRRRGREYLAARNQQMFEMRQRRKSAKEEEASTPPTPTSFDQMVDEEGKLWLGDKQIEPGSSGASAKLPLKVEEGMKEVENALSWASLAGESSGSGVMLSAGSETANPFGDEHALSRSTTPKPPVPPKIKLEEERSPTLESTIRSLPGDYVAEPASLAEDHSDLSYDEQMAIALSLSEEESRASSRRSTLNDDDSDDSDLKAALKASLQDEERRRANMDKGKSRQYEPTFAVSSNHSIVQPTPRHFPEHATFPYGSGWQEVPVTEASVSDDDELYRVTPQFRRSVPVLDRRSESVSSATKSLLDGPAYESDHQARLSSASGTAAPDSLASNSVQSPPSDVHATPDAPLIDIGEEPDVRARTPTPTSRDTIQGFQSDSDSQSDIFASFHEASSRAASRTESHMSDVEVVDVDDDSDVDMLSEDGDGIATPDSWTEVGSQTGESEDGEFSVRSQ